MNNEETTMQCIKCKFFNLDREYREAPDEFSPDDVEGECRRHPPRLDEAYVAKWLRDWTEREGGSFPWAWVYPAVYGSSWCGEFQPRQVKAVLKLEAVTKP